MWLLMAAVLVLIAGGCLAWLAGRDARLAAHCGAGTAVLGSLLALGAAGEVLLSGRPAAWPWAWPVPCGTFAWEIDALSAAFLLPIAVVVAAGAVYGHAYVGHACRPSGAGSVWWFFNLLAASMLLVITARNSWLFLVCWEVMTLASFFLVLTQRAQEASRRAAVLYLAAMHVGTSCLLVLFLLLGQSSGSLDWRDWSGEPRLAGAAFVLAVIGFGAKAGFVPLHLWLPEAHPAAPSHVSAVMSGVMIKTGIYGLLRTVTFLGPVAPWWGWTLIALGAASGLYGILLAHAQRDLKRLLAYSSVENLGIVTLGLGVGLLGLAHERPVMAFLGLAGGLLHVLNHALFKSLLFLGAGAVQVATGSRDLNRLGGLWKRMPVTGATFLLAACAIAGLPPLNGFISEVLIYLGALSVLTGGTAAPKGEWVAMCVLVVGCLALMGGLAAACFAKAFGCVFLGEPRSAAARGGREVGRAMRGAMVSLAALCAAISLTAPLWPQVLAPACAVVAGAGAGRAAGLSAGLDAAHAALAVVGGLGGLLLAGVAGLAWWRARVLAGRPVQAGPTWGCGYAAPSPRMQYTAASFGDAALHLFRLIVRRRIEYQPPDGLFPQQASFASRAPDVVHECLVRPSVAGVARLAAAWRGRHSGRLQLDVLYIALTILVLFVWKLR